MEEEVDSSLSSEGSESPKDVDLKLDGALRSESLAFAVKLIRSPESIADSNIEDEEISDELEEEELRVIEDEDVSFFAEASVPDVFVCGTDDEAEDDQEAEEEEKASAVEAEGTFKSEVLIRPDFVLGYNLTGDDEWQTSDFTLLDPNHPQMRRFQDALWERQRAKNHELLAKIKEMSHELKKKKSERDDLAFHLNFLQGDLDKAKLNLAKQEEEIRSSVRQRLEEEEALERCRAEHEAKLSDFECMMKRFNNVKTELNNTNLKNVYLESEDKQLRDNISVTKMCVARSKQVQAEVGERQQEYDLWITRLNQKIESLEEGITMMDSNLEAQQLERKELTDGLREATVEFDVVQMELKHLMQSWNCMITISEKKEETFSATVESYRQKKNELKIQTEELEKVKRRLTSEHETMERQREEFSRLTNRVARTQKILVSRQPEYRDLKEKICKFENILRETGEALTQATNQSHQIQSKITKLSKIYDHHLQDRNRFRDEVLEKVRESEVLHHISEKLAKQLQSVQNDTLLLEKELISKENAVTKGFVKISKQLLVNDAIEKLLKKLTKKIDIKDNAVSSGKTEMTRLDSLIKQKDAQMVVLQNRIDHLLSQTGGRHINPYELQLSNLNDTIERENAQINEVRKIWLADQAELVHTIKERDAEEDRIKQMRQEITLLGAKKMRIEGEIEREKAETAEVEKRRKKMVLEVSKVNASIFKERSNGEVSVNEQKFSVQYFNAIIKEEQTHLIELQEELGVQLRKKEENLRELVEIEQQILLWERKVHIAKEMKATFLDIGWMEEIKTMKSEIWKMELRRRALGRETEKLHQTLERLAVRTVDLLGIDETSEKAKRKAKLNRQISDLRDKVKQKKLELKHLEKELHKYADDGLCLQDEIFRREVEINRLQNLSESMEDDVKLMKTARYKNVKDNVLCQALIKELDQSTPKTQAGASSTFLSVKDENLDSVIGSMSFVKLLKDIESHHPEASDELKSIIDGFKSKPLDYLRKYGTVDVKQEQA